MNGDELPACYDEDEDDADGEEEEEPEDEDGDNHEIHSDVELDLNEDEEEEISQRMIRNFRDPIISGIPSDEVMSEPRRKSFWDFANLSEDIGFRRDHSSSVVESPQNITVETVFVSDLPREMVQKDESTECKRNMIRTDAARARRQSPPNHLGTVGITNISASSAFNSFMQLINIIPAEMQLIKRGEHGTFEICDFASIFMSHMQTCFMRINMSSYIVNLCNTTGIDSTQLLCELSDENYSVTRFVEEVIDLKQITFMQNKQSKWLIDVTSTCTFEAALKEIDPESIPSYIFASIKDPEIDSPLPWQVKLMNSRCMTFLMLKCYVSETNGEFTSYIRQGTKTHVLRVKDDQITELLHAPFQNATLALYYAHKQHLSNDG